MRPPPPTTYPSGLQPVGSGDLNGNRQIHRRVSRTDLDFEQALRAEGTFVLKEGLDVNTLGLDTSPSPMNASFGSPTPSRQYTPRNLQAPATPTVVPPTPSPIAGPSSARNGGGSSSQSSSSHDVFYDAEDTERQTNRRSMYRSPGTSSSPDLATLLRKAKAQGGVVGAHHKREKRRESPPPPVPDRPSSNGRQRSSTSYSSNLSTPQATPSSKQKLKSPGSEWVLPSPRPAKENGTMKVTKSSVRAKTSAFLGKMLGQGGTGTVRERSKTDASMPSAPSTPTYGSPSLFDAFTPPVPPIPVEHRDERTPVGSPIADVFTVSQRNQPLTSKPLPPLLGSPGMRESDDVDERSMVFVERVASHEPPSIKPIESSISASTVKRRSLSVGDAELKKAMTTTSSAAPLPPTPKRKDDLTRLEDSTLNGILDDFKGELSQLDPIHGSLDLRDPSTPARRAALRSKTDGLLLSHTTHEVRPEARKSASMSTPPTSPTLTLHIPSHQLDDPPKSAPSPSPIVPPRSSSLQMPRPTARPNSIGSPRGVASRHASSPLRSKTGPGSYLPSPSPRDTARLRSLHRSTASSSEPSLIPNGGDAHALSAPRTSSQHDLTVNDLTLTRFSSASHSPAVPLSPAVGDDTAEMDARGKELASRCWNEDEEFLAKEKIAEWLGGHGRINKLALHHYVNFFDFSGLRLDLAFRRLCAKLYLKGETQQVDRILEEFSRRYWECNPGGLYGSANIVHAVSYSLLLLNTDLHVAELTTRMSRNQFVRNTLTAIQMQLQPTPAQMSTSDLTYDDCSSSIRGAGSDITETRARSKRSDSITSWNSVSREGVMSLAMASGMPDTNGSSPSVQVSSIQESRPSLNPVYGRGWESDMEILLKEMYNAIKSQQILQPLNSSVSRSGTSLSPGGATMLRNRSLRGQPDRLATLKRGSIRGLQSIINSQAGISPYSSNSSIDGRVSPSPSFATSTHEVMYGSSSSFLAPTLGFASNLSHTIIREAQEDDDRSIHSNASSSTTISITDEELALLGAPWAKEGMLCRKQYWESTGRRARDKAWLDVFVVIQKGELNMFTFGDTSSGATGTFGGGNWLSNAHPVGTIHLSHSLAHALPPPGYNRQRPCCMVLTMANGGVYFFQAGTEELVNEWVSTCNYWAARTSKEPLAGGVSNMEYGWNRLTDPYPHGHSQSDSESTKDYSDALSVRSGRSTRSKFGGWRDGAATVRAAHSPWHDKTTINDWKPPLPPTVSSVHDEEAQLDALRKHVVSMKKDLERHNESREPMAALYQPRSANAMKAQSNWEKKSQYLLTEIVKYDSYIDSLQSAMSLRLKKRGEKALERALDGNPPSDDSSAAHKGKWKGPEEETITEEAEPPTPGSGQQFNSQLHRRETADGGTND
ncbi:hypothetical protein Hypma_002582 [Hypsizygus marmoreus]|uniref:SEC7 domain-containing protein n=1 Tax=Hypsizygus marmoreus TaxID=39966 RepID=A0A369JB71_HYPMA|nr:hypothetical protein Hypma_002582 [Hypsizygus marmoreus]